MLESLILTGALSLKASLPAKTSLPVKPLMSRDEFLSRKIPCPEKGDFQNFHAFDN